MGWYNTDYATVKYSQNLDQPSIANDASELAAYEDSGAELSDESDMFESTGDEDSAVELVEVNVGSEQTSHGGLGAHLWEVLLLAVWMFYMRARMKE